MPRQLGAPDGGQRRLTSKPNLPAPRAAVRNLPPGGGRPVARRWQTGPGQARGWLPAVAALACLALAGCGHAAASDTTGGAGTAACADATRVDRLTIDRLNPLHQNFHFAVPAQITITNAHQAQAVARALCALPPVGHGVDNCPADWGIRYRLRFAARQH